MNPNRLLDPANASISRKRNATSRSKSPRKARGAYKKLLWFKQPFPDNYTDETTFLDHLQRNPRLQPYDFWSLMADASVIVQQLASVALFCCCFVAIFNGRVEPGVVVGWASAGSVGAWGVWDAWMGKDEEKEGEGEGEFGDAGGGVERDGGHDDDYVQSMPANDDTHAAPTSAMSPRMQQRLATVKSAALIYAAVLGLSPILKSLTLSTTSDSIWALSTWLLVVNVAFFDYSGGAGAHLPASISTNSAMMASAVLASRLPSTTHVFSLTLFSIEIFGLFPIFRRQLRARSPKGHIILTVTLVLTAWGGVFVTLTGGGRASFVAGVILGGIMTFFAMGLCCWWLIGLQKYKNEIHGPWDPARPIIRRQWD